MVDKKINIKVAIETANAAKSIGEINKSLKELKSAQESVDRSSPDFEKLSDAINNTEGRIGDLNDKFKTLTGSGVERVNASLGLMSEGIKNLDFDKFKIGLQGTTLSFKALSAAIAATGIGLLIQGITYLIQNFDELKKSGGFIGKMFSAIGDAISFVTDLITKFTDKIGLTESALKKQGEALKTNAEKAEEALKGQTDEYDRQIKAAEAAGKSTVKIELDKQNAIVETNKKLVEQTIAYVRSGGVLTDEQKKLLTEQLNAIKNAKNEEVIIIEKAEKKKNDEYKKHNEEVKKLRDEETAHRLDILYKEKLYEDELRKKKLEEEKKLSKDIIDNLNNTLMEQGKIEAEAADADFKIIQDSNDKERGLRWEAAQNELKIAQQSTDALQGLSDFIFTIKKTNLEKGSQAELETAKKQFKINKALAITSAVISTIQGVINALTAQSVIPEPFGTILKAVNAVAVGIAGAANIAKIAGQQFNPGGGSGGGATPTIPSAASSGAGQAAAAPSFGPQTFGINSGAVGVNAGVGGKIGGKEQLPPQKVYVTQGDIADQNKKVEVIQERATIG